MKMPTPDPVGQDANVLRPKIEAAMERGDVNEAVNLSVQATFLTAIAICRDVGIPAPRPRDTGLESLCGAFRDACDAHLATDEDFRVTCARDAFDAIAMVETALKARVSHVGSEGDTARLLLLGGRLGHADVMLGLVTSGLLAEYGVAVHALYNRGAHLRNRLPDWEVSFQPVAQAFCTGKNKVSLGALVLEARRWGEAERDAGRNPGIPATDGGITAGLKRMEARGLSIPGR